MKKVLIMIRYYIPAVRGGGPIQSIKNLIANMSDEYEFYIITENRDLGDKAPLENVEVHKWTKVGNANVYYSNSSLFDLIKMGSLINSIDYDVLYLNSFFDYKYDILPIILSKIGKLHKKPIILAPRGSFSKGALILKWFKKSLYINISVFLKLYKEITWHATSNLEKLDIQKVFGEQINVKIARNLTLNYENMHYDKNITKNTGELKIVFISRIHPKKNLLGVLEILRKIEDDICFDIYGPKEDLAYWRKCERLIETMNKNIDVKYKGIINNDEVISVYKKYHLSILLTLGENYGHSISESLIGGCPIIISNNTPWQNIHNFNIGWDIPLENENYIIDRIRFFVGLNDYNYKQMSKSAFEYAKKVSNNNDDIRSYINLLST